MFSFWFLSFSYTSRVVANGLKAQINNPELKVRGLDPLISNLIEKLQHFNRVSNFSREKHFIAGSDSRAEANVPCWCCCLC